MLKTLNSAVFGIAVSPNVVDGILARWYFVLWSNMLSNAARKLCVFIPSPYFQMRATIISAVSNLSTAYNLVNVNLTNVAWLHVFSFGHGPLWFRDALCSCKQSLTVLFRVFPPTFVSRAYIPVHVNLQ